MIDLGSCGLSWRFWEVSQGFLGVLQIGLHSGFVWSVQVYLFFDILIDCSSMGLGLDCVWQLHQKKWSEAVQSLQHAIRGYPTMSDLWEVIVFFSFSWVKLLKFCCWHYLSVVAGSGPCLPATWNVYCCYQGKNKLLPFWTFWVYWWFCCVTLALDVYNRRMAVPLN